MAREKAAGREGSSGTDGGTAALQKRANRSTDTPLDLAVRTDQERVKILDCRKEGRAKEERRERGNWTVTQVRVREKN